MPKRPAPPIETLIATVSAVSPDFAKVADLAGFGLRMQRALIEQGYELRKKSQPKPNGAPKDDMQFAGGPCGESDL